MPYIKTESITPIRVEPCINLTKNLRSVYLSIELPNTDENWKKLNEIYKDLYKE